MPFNYVKRRINKSDFYRQLQELNDKITIFKALQAKLEKEEPKAKSNSPSTKKLKTLSKFIQHSSPKCGTTANIETEYKD